MTLAATDDPIETERLVLRRITAADLPFFTRIHADPEVARYISRGRPRTPAETREWFDHTIEAYGIDLGQLAVTRKSDGALLGRCGIGFLEVETVPDATGVCSGYFIIGAAPPGIPTRREHELGYVFDRAAWGQGYAREAAAGVYAHATDRTRLDRVVSLIHPQNVRSVRVVQAFGATPVDRLRYFETVFDLYLWPNGVR